MKTAGILIGVVGFVMLLLAMTMTTSVSVDQVYSFSGTAGMRVNNLGLMAEKQNSMLLALAFIIIGVLLYGFGSISTNRSSKTRTVQPIQAAPQFFTSEDLMKAIATGDVSAARKIVNSGLDLKQRTGPMTFIEYADFHDQVEIKEIILMKLGL
ncbi:MAG: hypothetical protein HY309_19705 [Pseudomonas fluorescens]|jgi:hypothetical protein|nr:hypothetical protein [Pseudomonas fluorescens]